MWRRQLGAGGCKQCCTKRERRGQQGRGPRAPRGPTVWDQRTKVGRGASYYPSPPSAHQGPHNIPPPRRPIPSRVQTLGAAAHSVLLCDHCPVVGQSVSLRREMRSDTLVRYRQRTLSKASGPPAWMWVLRLSDGVTGSRVVSAGSQNGCGVEKCSGSSEEMHAVRTAAQVGARGVVVVRCGGWVASSVSSPDSQAHWWLG